jgi:hypothetical protein
VTRTAASIRIEAGRRRGGAGAALLALSVTFDAVATGIWLVGDATGIVGAAAVLAHGMAILLLSCSVPGRPSERCLYVAALSTVPLVGAAIAAVLLIMKTRGSRPIRRRVRLPKRPAFTTATVRRLGEALSAGDALACEREEERRAALTALAQREEPEAIALLRWAAAGRDPDLALSAALVLDEISERAERERHRRHHLEVRLASG